MGFWDKQRKEHLVNQRNELIRQILKQVEQPIWDNWIVKEKIGVGSFSEVYRIEAEKNGKLEISALKIEPLVANRIAYSKEDKEQYIENAVKLAENETNIMDQLRGCPNIVHYEDKQRKPLYINGRFEGYYQLLRMELLTCVSDLLHKKAFVLLEENVKKLAIEIGNGISVAHKNGIIHRDIKPDNLFISRENVYKLGDFNVSKQSDMGNTVAGTDEYMAPEIYRKAGNHDMAYTKQADIYSFGITLYYLMNGLKFPLEDAVVDLEQALIKRMLGAKIPPPQNASQEFGEIIQKACAYKEKERYQAIDEMLEDIKKLPKQETGSIYQEFMMPVEEGQEAEGIEYTEETKKDKGKKAKEKIRSGIEYTKETKKVKKWLRKKAAVRIGVITAILLIVVFITAARWKKDILLLVRGPAVLQDDDKENNHKDDNYKNDNDKEDDDNKIKQTIGDGETIPAKEKEPADKVVSNISDFDIENGVLKKYIGSEGDVVIPDIVTDIGEKAFIHCKELTSITMPDSIVSIGFSAFAWCKNLESVKMSVNVAAMEKNAFRGCRKLKSIVIPGGVKKVKMRAFEECKSLTHVEFSEGVEEIGVLSFNKCKSLQEIVLPKSMKKVYEWGFLDCKNLEKVTVLSDSTKIQLGAFDGEEDGLNIYCSKDSKAFKYAKNEGLRSFIVLF